METTLQCYNLTVLYNLCIGAVESVEAGGRFGKQIHNLSKKQGLEVQ
jgi:hypothetical protein